MIIKHLHFKRAVLPVLFVLLLNAVGMTNAMAQSFTVGDLNYSVNNDGVSVTVIGHVDGTAATGSLSIPEIVTYEGNNYSVTTIGYRAFRYCSGLTGSLTIPISVTTIDGGAFNGCSGFTGSLTIPNSVTTIDDWAFKGCSGFTGSLTISNSVTTIGNSVFMGCHGITGSLTIPNSVTTIGGYAFYGCSSFTGSLTIPNSVTAIGDLAFNNCSGFTGSLTIPNSVTSIGGNPFSGCSGLEQIEVESGNTVYDSRNNCNAIINTNTNELISGCMNSTIPNSVTTIGTYAFYGCSGFTGSLTIPNSVTTISRDAFSSCSGLSGSLTIPNSVTSIGGNPFSGCSGLEQIEVESGNTVYDSRNNCNAIVETNTNTLISGCMNSTIPNSVTTIGGYAFYGCSGFTGNLTIPNSVTTIGNFAFSDCSGFTGSLTIPNSVTMIGNWAFSGCSGFTDSLTIPNSVITIGVGAFYDCSGFTGMYSFAETPPSVGTNAFFNVPKDIPVYVPSGTIEAYQNATGWNEFTNYHEIEGPVLPTNYISDGLIMYLDGIYNTRNGHSTTTDVWEDLMGNYDLAVSNYSSYTWEDNHFIGLGDGGYLNTGQTWQYFNSLNDDITIEIVTYIDCDKTTPSYRGLAGWHMGSDGTNFQNDQGSGRMQTLGALPVTEADDQIATVSYTRYNGSFLNGLWKCNDERIRLGINSGYTVVFGNSWAQCRGWNDSIYCIRMYNRTLTSEEIEYNHSIDVVRFGAGNGGTTPLGEFTYMSPTDNYPFTSLPIEFSWDAVSNAQYYDLYLWNANDPIPEEPYVSGLTNGYYRCSSLPNHQTYQWYVKAYNPNNAITSNIRTFTVDVEPALSVSMQSINFGEVALNHTAVISLNIEGVVLEDIIQIQLDGEDASMFSYTTASGWDDYTGGTLLVNFTPTISQYEFHATLVVSSGTLTQTIALSGSVADTYTFNTYVDGDVYAMNTAIPIHGTVTDNENAPAANVDVEIGVFVMGMKRSLQATTNASGEFSATFEPMPSESGYYTVNSGRVGNNSTAVHDDFNIPGMAVVTEGYILCAVTQDQPKTDTIQLRNKSNLPLNNIQVSVLSAPEGCSISFMPLSLGGLETAKLVYTVNGTELTQGNYYQEIKLRAISSEGASTDFSIWYYCKEPKGILNVTPNNITTTMTKGKSKIVDVMLSNHGTAATGNIFIDLPDVEWMSVVGNDTLPSLPVNDTAYFSLRFSPGEDIPLVQYSGNIAINCEHGEFANLPFAITAVSDSTGTFIVDITDDYTWNTNNGNGPHLEGAEVTLKGYYSLETVAQGFTDANGIFQVNDLPEGYYRLHVEADHHSEYDNNILITAGETNNRSIYLQYQGVSYSWTVEPTEIPDEYTIELNVVYETNVPAPVVTIDISSQVPELEVGESYTFNAIVTNHGLIAARDFQLIVPELSEYMFYPLYDFIDSLPALTTVVIPITVNRVQTGRYHHTSREDDPCWARLGAMMYYVCGKDYEHNSDRYVWHYAYSREVFINTCVLNALANQLPDLPCFGCGGGSGSGSGGGIIEDNPPESHFYEVGCHPCDNLLKDVALSLPILSDFNYASGFIGGNKHSAYDHVVYWGGKLPKVGWIVQAGVFAGNFAAYLHCKWEYEFGSKNQWLNLDDFDYVFRLNDDIIEIYHEFYQDSLLYEKQGFELLNSLMMPYYSDIVEISEDDAETIKSNLSNLDIPVATINEIIDRWNQTVVAWNNNVFEPNTNYPNIINKVHLESIGDDIGELCNHVISLGYDSFYAMIEDLYDLLDEEINNMSNSVCSHVTVQFSQKMTMTREAFEGTFIVHNGHDTNAMEGIGLNFTVKDEDGNDCTDLFQINTTFLTNLTAIDGSGSLGAGMDGMAKILFIPTKQAAPIEPKVYYFGGTFSFIDPYTSDELVYDLYPVDLTVHPSPDLYVDYFMQRDILGDDALTLDKVEPSIPAELGVIINNKGAGVAKNVILETAEPKIIDNDKGLAIDFAMYGASFNGNEAQLGLMSIPFGNIESNHTVVGEWLFTSSLLGHFVSYEAHVIHNNSYGNPNLSLVSHLDIHELIHPIRAYGNLDDGINDFLVNDVADYHDYPDSIYFSNGGRTGVGLVDDIHFDHYVTPLDTVVILSLNPSTVGWNYGIIDDPGSDKYELVSCTRRTDNQVIPMNNVWQTYVTLKDASDPIYENKLHIVDTLSNPEFDYTYSLVYSLKRDVLGVEEIIGIPTSDFIEYPLESFSVKFNKPIADSTFTYEDIVLKCNNGNNLMNPSVIISKVNDDWYDVNIAGLTYQTGYYVLNVNTLNINDTQGYSGYDGKQASWIQVLNGDMFVHINGNQTICDNESFEPLTSVVVGEYNALQWKRGGTPIVGANNLEYQPSEPGVYTLTVSFGNGEVITSNEVTLVLNPISQVTINDEICEGEEYTLNGYIMTGLSAGVYNETLYLENVYHCDSVVSVQLVVHENPDVHIQVDTIFQNGISFKLTATGAENYVWSTGETTASIMVLPVDSTTYYVVGTNSYGCSGTDEVSVFGGTGVGEYLNETSVLIFPNPTHEKLFIKASSPINIIEVFTVSGILVYRQIDGSDTIEINVQNLSPDMYFIRLITDDEIVTRKFIKE